MYQQRKTLTVAWNPDLVFGTLVAAMSYSSQTAPATTWQNKAKSLGPSALQFRLAALTATSKSWMFLRIDSASSLLIWGTSLLIWGTLALRLTTQLPELISKGGIDTVGLLACILKQPEWMVLWWSSWPLTLPYQDVRGCWVENSFRTCAILNSEWIALEKIMPILENEWIPGLLLVVIGNKPMTAIYVGVWALHYSFLDQNKNAQRWQHHRGTVQLWRSNPSCFHILCRSFEEYTWTWILSIL